MKVANPIDRSMFTRIKKRGKGWVFSAHDFLDLGSRSAVDTALSRMAAAGSIRRVARGLYDLPQQHPIVGVTLPDIQNLTKALAGKSGTRLQPTGAYAANLLGLSEQVPAKIVFLTDGNSKHVRLGNLEVTLKKTSPRMMVTAGTTSGLVIQALRHLGKGHVNDFTLKRLNSRLSPADRQRLIADAGFAPAWIGAIMKQLATSS